MDKTLGEDEVKGLEAEIDDAVERLFVEIKKGLPGHASMESPVVKPPPRAEKEFDPMNVSMESPVEKPPLRAEKEFDLTNVSMEPPVVKRSPRVEKDNDLDLSFAPPPSDSDIPFVLEPSSSRPPPPPPPLPPKATPSLNPLEKLETQILSLEWEITKENLKKAMEEILAVRAQAKENPQIVSTLNLMGKVIHYMMKNEGDVTPPFVKFLLDSKETIKLLMRKGTDQETATFKQLVYAGIEAKFASLEGLREVPPPPPPSIGGSERMETTGVPTLGVEKMQELLTKINLFLERTEELIKRMGERSRSGSGLPPEAQTSSAQITVFKIGDKFFGVESEKIFKLFKVPDTFEAKFSNQSKILLRGIEVRMVDLKKRFSIAAENRKEGIKLLTVNDQGVVKGWIIDQILKQVSATPEREGEGGKDVLGKIYWTYKDRQVTVPILDTKRL
jgi:chemotaxis signal transduction protein